MRSKYGARKTTIDNIVFHSKAEAEYYHKLKMLKRAKQITDFDLQPEYVLLKPFRKNGKAYRGIKYKADFLITHLDGSQEVIDVKGYKTAEYRMKKQLFESLYPDLTIIEVSA